MGYIQGILLRFITYALPALLLLLALFGFAVELLDAEPHRGSVIRLALFDTPRVPAPVVLGAWLMEASGLLALFLLARGRFGTWWLDGLVVGGLAWIFRGPLLVITIVVAARQPQHPWWTLAFGWWVLYSICGLVLAQLARRTELDGAAEPEPGSERPPEAEPVPVIPPPATTAPSETMVAEDREVELDEPAAVERVSTPVDPPAPVEGEGEVKPATEEA